MKHTGGESGDIPIIATLRIEASVSNGEIILPDFGPAMLSQNAQENSFIVPEGVALYDKMLLRVGRAPNNDLILNIGNVSRFHAVFTASSSGVVLSDLNSKNGTLVNGRRINTPVNLETGDVIDIGPARITVKLKIGGEQTNPVDLQATEVDSMISAGIVTVLVADVRNYTRMSEELPAADIAEMLNIWFDRISEIIERHGGEVDKYIGDCVMALWRGSDSNAKSFTNNAVKAAIEIKKETKALSESSLWRYRDQFAWACRVSLNTGKALMGSLGGRNFRDYTVVGDAVNVAFRLDSLGSQMGQDFILSESTAEYVKDAFELLSLGLAAVKGRTQKVQVYSLAG